MKVFIINGYSRLGKNIKKREYIDLLLSTKVVVTSEKNMFETDQMQLILLLLYIF